MYFSDALGLSSWLFRFCFVRLGFGRRSRGFPVSSDQEAVPLGVAVVPVTLVGAEDRGAVLTLQEMGTELTSINRA